MALYFLNFLPFYEEGIHWLVVDCVDWVDDTMYGIEVERAKG